MGIKAFVTDSESGKTARVNAPTGEDAGLVVAVRDLKSYSNSVEFFTNATYGADMNKNAAFGGTPIEVHNGTDNAYWTATAITGSWTFNSTTQAHAGTKSIDATATSNNGTAQLAKGSTQSLTGYVAVTGWIYLTGWSEQGTKAIEIYGWNTSTNAIVGNMISINDYIDTGTLSAWQPFAISLEDMALVGATIDAIRIRTIDLGPGSPPDYYLDDIQIEETGTPISYKVEPTIGSWLRVHSINITMADAYTGTLSDATVPKLPYNAFLGVSKLTIGLVHQRVQSGDIEFSANIKQLIDFLQFPDAKVTSAGSDGTNTWLKISVGFTEPVILKHEDGDYLQMVVTDDLSGLLYFRMTAGCRKEDRS